MRCQSIERRRAIIPMKVVSRATSGLYVPAFLPDFGEDFLTCLLGVNTFAYATANYAPNKRTVYINAPFHRLSVPFCDEREQGFVRVGLRTLGSNDSEREAKGIDIGKEDEVTQIHAKKLTEILTLIMMSSMKIIFFP